MHLWTSSVPFNACVSMGSPDIDELAGHTCFTSARVFPPVLLYQREKSRTGAGGGASSPHDCVDDGALRGVPTVRHGKEEVFFVPESPAALMAQLGSAARRGRLLASGPRGAAPVNAAARSAVGRCMRAGNVCACFGLIKGCFMGQGR